MRAKVAFIQWHRAQSVTSVSMSPTVPGRFATSGSDNFVRIWQISEIAGDSGTGEKSGTEAASTVTGSASASLARFCGKQDSSPHVEFYSTLFGHSTGVNVVRWSRDGTLIATGDNYGVIFIWSQLNEDPAELLSNQSIDEDVSTYKEAWARGRPLMAHQHEVNDIAWSPCSSYIASAGTDQKLRIWDVKRAESVGSAQHHTEIVQGVTWDPTGSFIATQSVDRSIHVYSIHFVSVPGKKMRSMAVLTLVQRSSRLSNVPSEISVNQNQCDDEIAEQSSNKANSTEGSEEETNDANLEKRRFHFGDQLYADPSSTGMSFFRRPDFSPDGMLLACPAAQLLYPLNCLPTLGPTSDQAAQVKKRKKVHAVAMYTRNCIASRPEAILPGFRTAAWVVRFSPLIYKLREPDSGKYFPPPVFKLPHRLVYAVGTDDGLYIYDTQDSYPLVAIHNMHLYRYQDVAWSCDGQYLVAASHDGYCTVVSFDPNEIGEPIPQSEQVRAAPLPPPSASQSRPKATNAASTTVASASAPAASPAASPETALAAAPAASAATSAAIVPAAAAAVVPKPTGTLPTKIRIVPTLLVAYKKPDDDSKAE